MLSSTYLQTIFDVDVNSLFSKVPHCVHVTPYSCPVQGSPLKGEFLKVHGPPEWPGNLPYSYIFRKYELENFVL